MRCLIRAWTFGSKGTDWMLSEKECRNRCLLAFWGCCMKFMTCIMSYTIRQGKTTTTVSQLGLMACLSFGGASRVNVEEKHWKRRKKGLHKRLKKSNEEECESNSFFHFVSVSVGIANVEDLVGHQLSSRKDWHQYSTGLAYHKPAFFLSYFFFLAFFCFPSFLKGVFCSFRVG